MKIHKGDNVVVVSGKDRGKTGKVLRAFPRENKVVVEGVNVLKKHQRAQKKNEKGQILDKTMPIHVSNVMLVDSKAGTRKRTRVGYSTEKGSKVRIARASGSRIT